MTDRPRLIERAFPLKEASIDSVHEKNVRHGHISTLHIWPARRPLAASRAALIATLLPDPEDDAKRKELLLRLGGKIVKKIKKKKMPNGKVEEIESPETEGGILHWGNESGPDLAWFRDEIRKAYGGRAPRVLDPFAGGGAIPLEAMRLGCEVTAVDINPVAWFLLKCTLEYPQRFAGKTRRLPEYALKDRSFMEEFLKARGVPKKTMGAHLERLGFKGAGTAKKGETLAMKFPAPEVSLEADLAWHVRAWGKWVLDHARADLERFYPTIGGKPTVAYLWARTVKCKNCRAEIPLLKTRWLCKKDNKRVLLTMAPNKKKTGVDFEVETGVPPKGGNAAQKREHDRRLGAGTMSNKGVWCPCCGKPGTVSMTLVDIQMEHQAGRAGSALTCVVVDGEGGKEYRSPTPKEWAASQDVGKALKKVLAEIPHGRPTEPISAARPSPNARGLSGLPNYGLTSFDRLFNDRQLLSLAVLSCATREIPGVAKRIGIPSEWADAARDYLALVVDRVADRNSTLCHWDMGRETLSNTFQRYALRINWDFAEVNPFGETTGSYLSAAEWVAQVIEHVAVASSGMPAPSILRGSSEAPREGAYDVVVTDPPYYDAIPYADLSDFFYVWLRRTLDGAYPVDFSTELTEKALEIIQHAGRMDGDNLLAKKFYEDKMAETFQAIARSLTASGRFVIVFAHKQPDAWETLASAIIRAGFVVDSSWPIQTEMPNKAAGGARLASSVWLVCKKRPEDARPGWDAKVLDEMRERIHERLREFWDAGIRGPDFVWAATGPALEAYSKHPIVKKANEPGKTMEVSEFLRHVRRIVVDFVVGQVLHGMGEEDAAGLDDVTTYYLLHRRDFGMGDAPIGACILYAVSCGLSDSDLADRFDLLAKTGGKDADEEEEPAEDGEEAEEGTGSKVKLKAWNQRKRPGMGYDPSVDSPKARAAAAQEILPGVVAPVKTASSSGREIPLIDKIHRLMHLWKAGDVVKVDEYLDSKGLRRNALFQKLLQALIETATSDERPLLESISNHVRVKGEGPMPSPQLTLAETTTGGNE